MMKKQSKNERIDGAVFLVLLAAATAITFLLFYRQTLGSPESYHSDMKAYILEMQGLDSGYHFPYPVFFRLSAAIHTFTSPELAVALATTLLNSLSMVVMKLALNHLTLPALQKRFANREWLAGVIISVVAVSLFFISMLFLPEGRYLPGIKYRYLGVFTSNPFHNATYMAARPFALLAFFWYAKLLPIYEQGYVHDFHLRRKKESYAVSSGEKGHTAKSTAGMGVKLQDYLLFSLFLLLATMTKPSFTIVLVATAGLVMLWRMFRTKWQNFVPTIQLGLCFIPTFLHLLYQYKSVFVPDAGEEGGMGFCLGSIWRLYCDNIPLAICLAIGFPLLVLVLHYKDLRTVPVYRFSWQLYLMSFIMAFFLYEKGFRAPDFNFSWGYMYGIFFSFTGSMIVLLKETAKKKHSLLLTLEWLAYLGHVLCGGYYFFTIFQGRMYY